MGDKSRIWSHFTKISNDRVTCTLCPNNKEFFPSGGNGSLIHHLKNFHGKSDSKKNPESASVNKDASGRTVKVTCEGRQAATKWYEREGLMDEWLSGSAVRACSSRRAEAITKLVVNCVTGDLLPLLFCENACMWALLKFTGPNYQAPSNQTIMAYIKVKFADLSQQLKIFLANMPDKVREGISISCDGWTNQDARVFSINCHFVDVDWNLKCYYLKTVPMQDRHTANKLAPLVDDTASEFGLSFHCSTTDTAANMLAVVKQIS